MSAAPSQDAVWFGPGAGVFGVLHAPPGATATGVVMVSPFGWEDMASYPSRRRWAEALAAAGHLVLRFDLPGTGDSPGEPGDPDELGAWAAAVAAGAAVLAGRGCGSVTALGIGFGGLVALVAVDRGAELDGVVLWGTPKDGKSFVRGERAFARFQTSNAGLEPAARAAPGGTLESGGYLLSAPAQAELGALRPAALRAGRLRRALLLEKDGVAPEGELVAALERQGVAVTLTPGPGYAAFMATPEHSRMSDEAAGTVAAWLAAAPADAAVVTPEGATRAATRMEVDGVEVAESTRPLAAPGGVAFGVVTEAVEASRPDVCVVLLPAWAERRCGPNRLWTRAARRCAARGVPAVRVDLPGIGDASGSREWLADVANLHDPARREDVHAVLKALEEEGFGPRFVLVGLCSGGYLALRAGATDHRVAGVLAMNADGLLTVEPETALAHAAGKAGRLLQRHWWRQALRGEVKAASVRQVLRASLQLAVLKLRPRPRSSDAAPVDPMATLEAEVSELSARGARVVVACTSDEPLQRALDRDGGRERLEALDHVRTALLPSRDHNLRPWVAQQAALDAIDELAALVAQRGVAT